VRNVLKTFPVCRLCSLLFVLFHLTGLAVCEELHIAESDARHAAVEKPAPEYPPMARQMRIVGTVVVEGTVDEQGQVESARLKVGNPILGGAATQAVKKWHFKPFTSQDKPAKAIVTLTFEFNAR
jgi:TonB family protein